MTAITILGGVFEILFEDETVGTNAVAGMKMVRRTTVASNTIYTTNALYSAVADAADEFQAMGFENPMLPVTPNAYTMENDYFIPRSSTEFLKEGAVSMDWTTNIRSIPYSLTGSPAINFALALAFKSILACLFILARSILPTLSCVFVSMSAISSAVISTRTPFGFSLFIINLFVIIVLLML